MSKCALHSFTDATHSCAGCDRPLCEECATRLDYCGACGGRLVRFGEEAPEHWVDTLFEKAVVEGAGDDPAAFVTLHALIPAAIITMVYSALFYLLLLRSLFFGNTGVLQWVGFLFVFGTVLIGRYGRTRNDIATQAAYSIVMLIATGMTLVTRSASTGAMISSMLLLGVVWLYATGVTYAVSLEGKGQESTRGAVAPVVALGVVAMVMFAVGEPLMLNAPPEVAIQGLLAIILFLLSAGVVMAASSTTSQARRTYRAGGEVTLRLMPLRLGAAAVLLLAVMAIALVLPAVNYGGSGRIQRAPDEILQQRPLSFGSDGGAGQIGDRLVGGLPWGWLSGLEEMTRPSGQARAALAVVRVLQYAGAALVVLIVLGLLFLAVSRWTGTVGVLSPAWRRCLAWLRAKVPAAPAWSGATARATGRALGDPFADLEALRSRPAREAVIEAYLRSTILLDRLGHPRPPAATPHDLLASLPERLRNIAEPLESMTGLYVRAAYSNLPIDDGDRQGAVANLLAMRDRLAGESA